MIFDIMIDKWFIRYIHFITVHIYIYMYFIKYISIAHVCIYIIRWKATHIQYYPDISLDFEITYFFPAWKQKLLSYLEIIFMIFYYARIESIFMTQSGDTCSLNFTNDSYVAKNKRFIDSAFLFRINFLHAINLI